MNKIIKTLGHCYDGCGWLMCDFWDTTTPCKDNPGKYATTKCKLFGNTEKYASEALKICDKTYGCCYEGKP